MGDFALTNMEGLLDTLAALLLAVSGASRLAGWGRLEADGLAAASVVLFFNLLHVLTPFRFFGGLMVTVHKMLRGDVPRFMVLYVAMHCGFAFGRLLLLRRAHAEEAAAAAQAPAAAPSDSDLVGVLFSPFWVPTPPLLFKFPPGPMCRFPPSRK